MAARREPALGLSMRSLQLALSGLEAQYLEQAARVGVYVCSYKLFRDIEQPTLRGFVAALGEFQSLYSLVYDALQSGPKLVARVSAESAAETEFGLAYTFHGSLGAVLTFSPAQLSLPGAPSIFDDAMRTVSRMVKASDPADIRTFARSLGRATVKTLYDWATRHVQSALGAEITWHHNPDAGLFVQTQELEQLRHAIVSTTEEVETELTVIGELVGADVLTKRFHIKAPDAEYVGAFSDAISREHTVRLPQAGYKAIILKRTKIEIATEKEEVNYFLVRLDRLTA